MNKRHLGVVFFALALVALFNVREVGAAPNPLTASSPTPLNFQFESKGRTAVVEIPKGCSGIVLEKRASQSSNWVAFRKISIKSGANPPSSLRVALPRVSPATEWRVLGTFSANEPINRKYPAAFYRGQRSFGAALAPVYSPVNSGIPMVLASGQATAMASTDTSTKTATTSSSAPAAEEPDIWKAEGTTLYFFNQLRGLQVISLADPAQPVLKAFLRLPASGQDLYVLAGEGAVRNVLLLTNEFDPASSASCTGIKVVRVEEGNATLVSQERVEGWLSENRLVGGRLYLATQVWKSNSISTTLHEFTVNPTDGALLAGNTHEISGAYPIVAAGPDWLAVAVSSFTNWQDSEITLFSLDSNGATQKTDSPIAVTGRIYDKFKIQYANDVLSVISQRWEAGQNPDQLWRMVSVSSLETFSGSGSKLGSLEITRGEQLHATRFADRKAYVVTFRQVDPLWVIDLSDPSQPAIAGSLEVPGWSTYIEPLGDLLFSIGYENGKVAASLFDVSNPAAPSLLKRLQMEGTWGYSEATYDEKALKVLPESGLAMIPYSYYDTQGQLHNYIQLLDLDVAGRDLKLRGTIAHDFTPRRATLIEGTLASISQQQLVTADISNRDEPIVLADLLLAWPVDRLLSQGEFLLEISDGNSWSSSNPIARIASVQDPDKILAETDLSNGLPGGLVKDAAIRENKLYVLTQASSDASPQGGITTPLRYIFPRYSSSSSLRLDIYDASNLPALTLLGSATTSSLGNSWDLQIGSLLWPGSNCAVVIAQPTDIPYWRYGGPVMMASAVSSVQSIISPRLPGVTRSNSPAVAIPFDLSNPANPVVCSTITLTEKNHSTIKSATADAGCLVFGFGANEVPSTQSWDLSTTRHCLRILNLQNPSAPILGPALDLPGRLFAVTDLTREGFLAWTESRTGNNSTKGQGRQIQASACDGTDVFLVARSQVDPGATMACFGRSLFCLSGTTVQRFNLEDGGKFNAEKSIGFDWAPQAIRPIENGLLGSDWAHCFEILWPGQPSSPAPSSCEVFEWEILRGLDMNLALPLPDKSLLVPAGDYGVEHLQP